MKEVRAGVIGVGHLGNHHTRIYKELGILEGIYDIDKDRAKEISEKYNCRIFKSLEETINNADIFSIATPANTHYSIAKELILKNKSILIEKPITVYVDKAEELIELSKDRDIVVQVGHSERFNPSFLFVKDLIKNPFFIESHRIGFPSSRGLDVAVVLDLMIHDIDFTLLYIKSPIKSISAIGAPILSNEIDIANARIEFTNGAIANIMVSRAAAKAKRKIRFFQKDAYISIDLQKRELEIYRRVLENNGKTIKVEKLTKSEGEPLYLEIQSFVNSVVNKEKVAVTAQEATKALSVSWKIVEAIKERYNLLIN